MPHKISTTEVGGETVPTMAGEGRMPYRDTHPCFGMRRGCQNKAVWRMDGPNLCLHWCEECRVKEEAADKWTEKQGYTWYPLAIAP